MATVFDIAKYILDKTGPISAMKLQKLVYYAQAWALVWDDAPLFSESKIEAWANGPVVRCLYEEHRGKFIVQAADFAHLAKGSLEPFQKETIDEVIKAYGLRSAQWLSDQTHAEDPWQIARVDMSDMERGEREITLVSMAEYYSSLQ